MYKKDIPPNELERLAIERRRQNEAARIKRILDAKNRVIGVGTIFFSKMQHLR
jgi:hypothetical protein